MSRIGSKLLFFGDFGPCGDFRSGRNTKANTHRVELQCCRIDCRLWLMSLRVSLCSWVQASYGKIDSTVVDRGKVVALCVCAWVHVCFLLQFERKGGKSRSSTHSLFPLMEIIQTYYNLWLFINCWYRMKTIQFQFWGFLCFFVFWVFGPLIVEIL